MCSDQGKVHSPSKVICPLEKISDPGNLSRTERLPPWQGHTGIFEKGSCLFVSSASFCLFLGEREFVANVTALQTLL